MLKNLFARLAAKIRGAPRGLTLVTAEERIYRVPRVALHPLVNVFFQRADDHSRPQHVVANFSRNGIGILRNALDLWPQPGSRVDGHLVIKGAEHPISFAVAHLSGGVVGGRVFGDATVALREIGKAFPVEVAAAQMSEVNRKILKPETDGEPRLYRNTESCELFFVVKDDQVWRFELSFFGNYIKGGQGTRTQVGFLWSEEPVGKPQYKADSTVRLSSKVSSETIDIALRLLALVPGLEASHSAKVRALISEAH